ncbi:hypothetical protein SAMN02745857_01579 [Andreprevotia lacus DSM 23236]|jgi:hypothetical protein|uniref:WG containing repeat-containing protein n=1 Tax=Andreprevotia lacus DSM 23236 TaxID=1121001 RepID=A0A1W1XHA5_9NEIS|nr:hypothetical protein [Andreprevotia lacus]SMC23207.1 hypothetical protein SAMN02745857_01579 [Andreprevotia lacus DSM 23236]
MTCNKQPIVRLLALLFLVVMQGCATERPDPNKQKRDEAIALYEKNCQQAGEKIYRTADRVQGLFLIKARPNKNNFDDQYELSDPYGYDVGGDGYIISFLQKYDHGKVVMDTGGFGYVDIINPKDGMRYRYTGYIDQPWLRDKKYAEWVRDFSLHKVLAPNAPLPRYGVTYDDISTHEDREHWIAGSSLKVVDLQTNEVMAERVGYMIDTGQGDKSGGRSPWLMAAYHACPKFPTNFGTNHPFQLDQARRFVAKVLRPNFDLE